MKYKGKKLTKDKGYFLKHINKVDRMLITDKRIEVVFPKRFIGKELCKIADDVTLVGYFLIVDMEALKYTVFTLPTIINMGKPEDIDEAVEHDEEFTVFTYDEGDIFIDNIMSVKQEGFIYSVFSEFITLGKIPFFFDMEILGTIFDNGRKYTGGRIGDNPLPLETLLSVITRSAKDPLVETRLALKDPIVYKGLSNVHYTIVNNLARITGSYTKMAIGRAMSEDTDAEATEMEQILKG